LGEIERADNEKRTNKLQNGIAIIHSFIDSVVPQEREAYIPITALFCTLPSFHNNNNNGFFTVSSFRIFAALPSTIFLNIIFGTSHLRVLYYTSK
jgi:hypothetical protein